MSRSRVYALGVAVFLLAFIAYAQGPWLISYQGKLIDANGVPLASGTYNMTFSIYDVETGGTAIWSEAHTGAGGVSVTGGYFNVILGGTTALQSRYFSTRDELWLEVVATISSVNETFTRTRLVPAPSAMTLIPGASVIHEWGGASFYVENGAPGGLWLVLKRCIWAQTNDGTALEGDASTGLGVYGYSGSGTGIYGRSSSGAGVRAVSTDYIGILAESTNHWSGWFTNGIRIENSGWHGIQMDNAAWAGIYIAASGFDGLEIGAPGRHGVHVHDAGQYGVYVEGAGSGYNSIYAGGNETARDGACILGVNSNDSGSAIWAEGHWGVVGDATGTGKYAGYFYDDIYVGGKIDVVGTVDPIIGERFSVDSSATFEVGDVVVIDAATGKAKLSTKANDPGVIGVIGPSVDIKDGELMVTILGCQSAKPEGGPDGGRADLADRTIARVKADASFGAIKCGDLLTSSNTAGCAMKAQPVDVGGVKIYQPGTIIGKALESLDTGTGLIKVFVTLQ
jgi:hypothetical protein